MSGPRVLVADDHALVRSGIVGLLEAADLEVVGEAGDGNEAVEAAKRLRPDVVLMDIRMPGLDGIEATARVAASPDPPRVLVLTTFDLDEYVYRALQAGASGFLLKDAPPERLVERSARSHAASRCSRRRSPAGSSSATSRRPSPASRSRIRPPTSRRANARCGCSSPAAYRTRRSGSGSSSVRRQ